MDGFDRHMPSERPSGDRRDPAPRPRARRRATPPAEERPRSRRASATQAQTGTRRRTTPSSASRGPARKAPRGPRKPPKKRGLPVRLLKAALIVAILGSLLLAASAGLVYASIARDLPDPTKQVKGRDQSTQVYDRSGRVIAKLFAEENRTEVPLRAIPKVLRDAVVSTEDERYYRHRGVDPIGITRALLVDIRRGKKAQGGSTITQQYVKIAFITPERTLKRKVSEAVLAYRLEKSFGKDKILEMYLNTIYFGHGAYGVESAAQRYFGKSVSKLSIAECAMIAGVIKSPGRYSPFLDPEAAKGRRATVLGQMLRQGRVDQTAYDTAMAEPIKLASPKPATTVAPYFMEYVKTLLTERYGSEAVYRGGLRVRTTIDLKMQQAAEQSVRQVLTRKDDPSAALVALDPRTGEILAMVGGRDFRTQQYNVAVQGRRQPGSAFKPFVLATALSQKVSPEKAFESGPASFDVPGSKPWTVTGAGGGRRGPMRLREATEKSVNSVFGRLILDVGADKVAAMARKLGIDTTLTAVPAIALGGLEEGVSPLQMASAYGTIDNGGLHVPPAALLEVKDAQGKVLLTHKPRGTRALAANVAFLTTDILKGVITAPGATGRTAGIARPAAGKTGTTQQYRDAWFVGYTPQIVTAVWVGYPDAQREMLSVHGRKVTGGSFPATIWATFMRKALQGKPAKPFSRPTGLVNGPICLDTGATPTPFCPKKGTGLFLAGTDLEPCELHSQPTTITVPNVVGMAKEAALGALKKLMLQFKVVVEPSAKVALGVVVRQDPVAGSSGTTQTVVTVVVSKGAAKSAPPVPAFVYSPKDPKTGKAVEFDAARSSDDKGIVSWVWEFGDGSQGRGSTVSHVYAAPGTYRVTLWVTDGDGQVENLSADVVVR